MCDLNKSGWLIYVIAFRNAHLKVNVYHNPLYLVVAVKEISRAIRSCVCSDIELQILVTVVMTM